MSYDDAQVISQLISMAIFLSLTIAAFVYAYRSSNKKKFDHVARAAIDLSDNAEKR